jgi:hypothetical protein
VAKDARLVCFWGGKKQKEKEKEAESWKTILNTLVRGTELELNDQRMLTTLQVREHEGEQCRVKYDGQYP